jgi:heat shock protein HspQ
MMDRDERLKQLAEMAPSERDLQKFMAFVREINLTLEEKQEHLARPRIPSKPSE